MWIVVAFGLFVAQIVTVLLVDYRHPSKTVAWLMIMTVFPFVGFVLYYFLAQEYKQRRKVKRRSGKMSAETRAYFASLTKQAHDVNELNERIGQDHCRLFAYLYSLPDAPITLRNETSIYVDGVETYEAMMEAIREARDHVHMEFYTIRSDRIGRIFQRLLIEKARAGVRIKIIYDGVGSYGINKRFVEQLKQAGAEVCIFLPPLIAFFDKRVNFRNHRKIVVVDGNVAFIGGINIGEEYVGGNRKLGFWRDTHLRFKGDAVYYIQHMFMSDWTLASGEALIDLPRYYPAHELERREAVQIIASGPDKNRNAILEIFFAAIASAQISICITTPYFIPDSSIAMALKTAAASGVEVQIIFPHHPDSPIVHWASLSYLAEMIRAGVKCYSYKKGFVHAKVLIIDGAIAAAGTANMDMRSFFSNFELNAVLFDRSTIERLEMDFQEDLRHCTIMEPVDVEERSMLHKLREAGARLLSPLL